jgi:5-methyltetrahydropteroyltriglutamate--homocysteine methyltransferase
MLDMTCLLGNIPPRFAWNGEAPGLDLYFQIARGGGGKQQTSLPPSEMTKWFDTNYHYIVPEFQAETKFQLIGSKPFDEFKEALALGLRTNPVLIGPLTYLYLGKSSGPSSSGSPYLIGCFPVCDPFQLNTLGAEWVQIDEPILAFELSSDWQTAFLQAYRNLRSALSNSKLLLATYFGELRENIPLAVSLPVDALHLDVTRAGSELDQLVNRLPSSMALSLGVVDGRNVWRNNFEVSLEQINQAKRVLSANRILIAPSCSLLHSPVTLRHELASTPKQEGSRSLRKS